jgi:sensor histidine kinase YesM
MRPRALFCRKKTGFVGTPVPNYYGCRILELLKVFMQEKMDKKSKFPLIYECIVWLIYTALYKYSYYINVAKIPTRNHPDFPHQQLLVYALMMTLYIVPFYRWLAPLLLQQKKYGWLILLTVAWFLFVSKISNLAVSYIFLQSNDPGSYHVFYESQFLRYKNHARHFLGWDLQILVTDLIAFSSVALTRYAFDNERNKRLLEKENFNLQLDGLKAQLNPHFLFNTLNSIYGMSLTGNKDTPQYVLRLADMMRYMLYDCREKKVAIEKDIEFTENYVAMEIKRYPDSDIRFTVTNNSKDMLIAPLLLIPFVENSFKHGAHRLNDRGFIHADLTADRDRLLFVVENDIFAIAGKQPGGIGIENIKKRLQLYYPGQHDLEIENTGTVYKVKLAISLNNKS